ncbi:AraC family transcriptional regulator [Dyadobacter beijingensis]|uniref:AraC family transcriptional regulator n=1 Tax=Dyadobacter beijingensis TaxID=365489 RepID=A0ABQ2I2B5_9BACT|nr:helix-turn-helix domain-containing protein [Dyadobacter beijingensis]GGM96369.1 AraC family transcriptional regulator [Dyadobacter beijingensis]
MKQVTIVVPKGNINLSSITGSFEILTRADQYWQKKGNKPLMQVHIAGFIDDLKLGTGYFSLTPANLRDIAKTDLIIIPSLSYDFDQVLQDNQELVGWIREQYKGGAEVASICTGAFLLAATGLLNDRVCSTHWNAANDFRRLFPNVNLQVDRLIAAEPGLYTNGGAYSFLNLILFLVEKYFDREVAVLCAKIFQIDIERSTQSVFLIFQGQKNHGDELIRKAQTYLEENLTGKISFEKLADDLAISRRNFDRRFSKATGNSPVEYLQRMKVELAKSILEKGRKSIFEVMNEVGYSDEKAFREVFKKISGVSPLEYRAKYSGRGVIAI